MAARRPAGAHAPAGLPAVPGPGAARRLLLAPASTMPWNWTASPRLEMNAARFTPSGRQALGTSRGAPHGVNASDSAELSQVLPIAAFQVFDSVDSQDGCEEGCHYCNGPETD
ncbi:hypothetical protein SB659_16885 [Arthrobacter sp. SIMBA_036]|uniref:hypothetical protein n=1 Tax=Arthrobacter sp. SIMBA_036 TaxID=3085778 RepID=UPI003979227E